LQLGQKNYDADALKSWARVPWWLEYWLWRPAWSTSVSCQASQCRWTSSLAWTKCMEYQASL